MDERRCVEVLRAHNEWRRYDGFTGEPGAPAMVNPTELGQALDHAIATIERERWRPIAEAPKDGKPVFVVIGVGVEGYASGPYTTDPYCVLAQNGWWARWPHPFPPTHWRPLPGPQPDGQEG